MAYSEQDSVSRFFDEVEDRTLTEKEEKALLKKIKKGDQSAKKELAEQNLTLVISIAKNYRNKGLSFPDLIQEGNLGLLKAIDRFDLSKGYKFSTYATWWIRGTIQRALTNKGRNIRMPAQVWELSRKIDKVEREQKSEKGKLPSTKELAEKLDVPEKNIRRAKKAQKRTASLDQPLKEAGGQEGLLKDVLVPEKYSDPEKEAKEETSEETLCDILKEALTDRERRILRLRYGLESYKERTLEEIGTIFNLSRERVRQIQKEGIQKLRAPEFKKRLKVLRTRNHT